MVKLQLSEATEVIEPKLDSLMRTNEQCQEEKQSVNVRNTHVCKKCIKILYSPMDMPMHFDSKIFSSTKLSETPNILFKKYTRTTPI